MFYRESDRQEIREWIQAAFSLAEEKFNAQILELRQEISDLKFRAKSALLSKFAGRQICFEGIAHVLS